MGLSNSKFHADLLISSYRPLTTDVDVDGAHKMLPMDVMLEIAGGTGDPATVVRLAATCKDLRRNIGDPSSFCRLRRVERLVPSAVLAGQLVGKWGKDLYVEDTACNLIATGCFQHIKAPRVPVPMAAARGWFQHNKPCVPVPVTARDGLVLVRVHHKRQPGARAAAVDLRVCNPSTGRVQCLPSGPKLRVTSSSSSATAAAKAARSAGLSKSSTWPRWQRDSCFANAPTASSAIPSRRTKGNGDAAQRYGHWYDHCSLPPIPSRHLVLGDAVYWIYHRHCFRSSLYYVFKLDVNNGKPTGLTPTALPVSFCRECKYCPGTQQILLAATAAGRPVVLVARHGRIYEWMMSEDMESWTYQPHVVGFVLVVCKHAWRKKRASI